MNRSLRLHTCAVFDPSHQFYSDYSVFRRSIPPNFGEYVVTAPRWMTSFCWDGKKKRNSVLKAYKYFHHGAVTTYSSKFWDSSIETSDKLKGRSATLIIYSLFLAINTHMYIWINSSSEPFFVLSFICFKNQYILVVKGAAGLLERHLHKYRNFSGRVIYDIIRPLKCIGKGEMKYFPRGDLKVNIFCWGF